MNPISFLIFAFLCICGLNSSLVAGANTIRIGEELNSSSNPLVSQGGNFTLGFFTLSNTNYSYFGIRYTNDGQARKVWVANPNTPLLDNSGVLTIDGTGVLKITSGGTTVVNISDQVGTGNVTATLDDWGNFVLKDETERTLWQSFDHPTDTLLPGMKLGLNLRTGQNWSLTSWLSNDVAASGAFTLSWESESGQLVIHRRGEVYWNSGIFKNQSFEFTPALNSDFSDYHYNLSHVSNNDERSFTFYNWYHHNLSFVSTNDESSESFEERSRIYDTSNENLPMWVLTPNGQILDAATSLYINPVDFCYGFQSDNGCANSEVPKCRGQNDTFVQKRRYFVGNAGNGRYDDNTSLSLSDCMEWCWNNCTCVAFTNYNGTGCVTWSANLEYRDDNPNVMIIYALVPGNSSKGKRWWMWLIIVVAISLLTLFLGLFCYLRIRKRRREGEEKKLLHELTASDSFNNANEIENEGREGNDLKIFSFASIVAATNDFSNENKLGQGGFGPVYKGRLSGGREIAIKRLSKTSGQGLVEFKNELILIAKLQHMNLVRVLGCCIHGEEKMLIYEYMPNKSLDFFLFDPAKKELLDWRKRLNIIEGVAQGLLYLHKYSRMRVIHRDLKASNILLDENMNPKISDFGMARIFKQNETEAITNKVVGTYGYMSPEYAMEGTFSVKSDVFSFGVLILEIVSGRRNTSFFQLDRSLNLIGYAWELWKEGTAMELKDPTLGDSCAQHQLLRTIHVGLLCVQECSTDRPIMSDVISMLSNETMPLPAPKQPAFFTGRSVLEASKSKATSVNGLSISIMEAR
uniref:Receptor-like serine/threonine-protein kinase n=1 Tax=Davidia involucrata TaxID=16924 RepID=A0A5B7AYL4_DAVIN